MTRAGNQKRPVSVLYQTLYTLEYSACCITTISSTLYPFGSVYYFANEEKEKGCGEEHTFVQSVEASRQSPNLSLQAALFKLLDNHSAFATDFSSSLKEWSNSTYVAACKLQILQFKLFVSKDICQSMQIVLLLHSNYSASLKLKEFAHQRNFPSHISQRHAKTSQR